MGFFSWVRTRASGLLPTLTGLRTQGDVLLGGTGGGLLGSHFEIELMVDWVVDS